MKKKSTKILAAIGLALVCAALVFVIVARYGSEPLQPAPTPTATPSPTPTLTPTPEPEYFKLSLVGDNTLAPLNISNHFTTVLNGDYKYPYKNTLQYFADDDLSIANLECVFSDQNLYSNTLFHFKAPSEYAKILTEGSIEFVTTANNHSTDYGSKGLEDTAAALEKENIAYGLNGETVIYETESGLKVGFYCATSSELAESKVLAAIEKLKADGAEYIICAFHWGEEGVYRPNSNQKALAHAAIDAGADLIYGSHPHVLQPVEEYGDGLILYSLGNWSFGGNAGPRDRDTAIVQVTVKRDIDGTVTTDSYELIPCCLSSSAGFNDYCPIPYDKDSDEYARTMSKLDGSFTGPDLVVDYSFMKDHDDEDDEPAESEAPQASESPAAEAPSGEETPTDAVE